MVEELLQFLVRKVDTELIETVLVENLEPGNVQHSRKRLSFLFCVQRVVTLFHEPFEHPVENGFRHGPQSVGALVHIHSLGHELGSDLDAWLANVCVHLFPIHTEQFGAVGSINETVRLGLLFPT